VIKISELRMREVINITDGKRLGIIRDIELDLEKGIIKAILVPNEQRFLGLFSRGNDYVISWDKIKKVGVDVILVEINTFTDPQHENQRRQDAYFSEQNNKVINVDK